MKDMISMDEAGQCIEVLDLALIDRSMQNGYRPTNDIFFPLFSREFSFKKDGQTFSYQVISETKALPLPKSIMANMQSLE